jgi:hypothetical protein
MAQKNRFFTEHFIGVYVPHSPYHTCLYLIMTQKYKSNFKVWRPLKPLENTIKRQGHPKNIHTLYNFHKREKYKSKISIKEK